MKQEPNSEAYLLEANLRKALKNQELRLKYQPKLDLLSGKILGVEALILWEHPEKGIIPPVEFIPAAEENGLIIEIGEWVLTTACRQNKQWQDMGLPPLVMAVNLSGRQLYQPNLIEMVKGILSETALSPQYLELEITESMMMDVQSVLPIIRDLKQIGVRISLDDFGTGYSSLFYLKEFPIDILKIDQCFVRNCTLDAKDATIVKTIIAMAHELELEVIAEGVETKEHLMFLQQQLCNRGQGYLFSRPLPPDEFIQKFAKIEQIVLQEGLPQEVSQKKWYEEALENARQELRETVRQQQGMIYKFIKRDGSFVHMLCDGELLYRLGFTPEQMLGKELDDFLPSEEAARKKVYYERAWAGEEHVTYEGHLNGIWYLASLRPVRKGGQVVEVIGSCFDITKRKLVEEALRQSEEKYRLIAHNMNDLIGVLDLNGIITYASPSHKTALGFPPHIYEGKAAFDLIHLDELDHIQKEYAQMVATKSPRTAKFRYKHATGGWVTVEAQGSPVLDEHGEVEQVVVVARKR